jgi:lipoprotein NlpI
MTKRMRVPVAALLICRLTTAGLFANDDPAADAKAAGHPLSEKRRAELKKSSERIVAEQSKIIAAEPKSVEAYSRRGDAYFFLADFKRAVADYEKMVELNRDLESQHWRRGIAYFYAGRYKDAARQFEIYNTFDMVDRENGIWRFFSQAKAGGVEQARKNLLKYKQDDREPFPDVYKLFAKDVAPEQILKNIAAAKIDKTEREKRLFYAHLYIGLNHALEGRDKPARVHLRKAVANEWGPEAGYGPRYMWHVGRLQGNAVMHFLSRGLFVVFLQFRSFCAGQFSNLGIA